MALQPRTPELATLFQIQYRLDALVAAVEGLREVLPLPPSPPIVELPPFPTPQVTVETAPVDLTDISLGLAVVVERLDVLTDAVTMGKTLKVERDPAGRIVRVTAEPMRLT